MLPATYAVQKEVQLRQKDQRHEAGQWRLGRVARGAQEPAVGSLLGVVAHTTGAVRAGLEKLRSGAVGSSEPQQECC
jgi:hypothetical protein